MALFKKIAELIGLSGLPPVDSYGIEKRPRRNVPVDDNRGTKNKVSNGKIRTEDIDDQGRIVTTIGKKRVESPSDVQIDKFDAACLDFVVGVKWNKDPERAAIMKWHWLCGESAAQIELFHTDKTTRQLERGFSERTAATYIKAFYDADDERETRKIERIRPQRTEPKVGANSVEW